MRKSFFIETTAVFGNPLPKDQAVGLIPSLPFSAGGIVYSRTGKKSCIAQDFKGRLGYLQQYDFILDEAVNLPVTVKQADLYVVYLIQATKSISLRHAQNEPITTLNKKRALYIYLPAGQYALHIPGGSYQLFGFYFDVGIFDDGADQDFDFLQPLLEAHRQKSSIPITSSDFMIGPVTEIYIRSLCQRLKKANVDNQIAIIAQLKELIQLSKRKIDRELGIGPEHHDLLEKAKTLIQLGVDASGINYAVSSLTHVLPIGEQNLQILFRKHFGITPNNYKKNYLIEKAKMMLITGDTVLRVADQLGFTHERSFYRLFKRCTGMSPKDYHRQHTNNV